MQTFLKILGFITIFIGIILGIYVISQSLNDYSVARATNNPYLEQLYIVKLVAGGAIIMSSIVSGMLYLSFGIVIELLDSINQKMSAITTVERKKEETESF
jgi:uncharacterized protein YacL